MATNGCEFSSALSHSMISSWCRGRPCSSAKNRDNSYATAPKKNCIPRASLERASDLVAFLIGRRRYRCRDELRSKRVWRVARATGAPAPARSKQGVARQAPELARSARVAAFFAEQSHRSCSERGRGGGGIGEPVV